MSGLRFAIIGCGRIAQRHAEHIAASGQLVAVCDIVPEKAHELAVKYKAIALCDIDELLALGNYDVVSVCTPNWLHAAHSIKALEAGFHVLCEKPMAIRTVDCRAMISAAEKAERRLFVVKQNRYNPPVAALRQLVVEGQLGKLHNLQLNCFWNRSAGYYINSDWKGKKLQDGGILFTQFSHFIDLVYWIAGDVKWAKALTANYLHAGLIEFEDSGVVLLQFENGMMGSINFTINSYGHNMEGSLTVFGEKGTVKIGGTYLNELEYQQIADYRIDNLPAGNTANNYGTYQGSMSNHDKVYENVISVIADGAKMTTTPYEAAKTVEIIEKIYSSAIRL